MNPFFFGDSASPLYGVFHPANVTNPRSEGILLCAPFGQEYMRSHRAFRQLANLLNKEGYPVLRFDYRGTGDAHGEPDTASVADWINDIKIAAEELKHTAQVQHISVVGLRLGGLLASTASGQLGEVQTLALWDTIVSGDRYVQELSEEIASNPNSKSKCFDDAGNLHFNGFALYKHQLDALSKMDLTQQTPKARHVVQLCSSENAHQDALKQAWSSLPGYEYQHVPAPGDWNFVDDFGGILLPQQIIQAIVHCFKNKERSAA